MYVLVQVATSPGVPVSSRSKALDLRASSAKRSHPKKSRSASNARSRSSSTTRVAQRPHRFRSLMKSPKVRSWLARRHKPTRQRVGGSYGILEHSVRVRNKRSRCNSGRPMKATRKRRDGQFRFAGMDFAPDARGRCWNFTPQPGDRSMINEQEHVVKRRNFAASTTPEAPRGPAVPGEKEGVSHPTELWLEFEIGRPPRAGPARGALTAKQGWHHP